MRQLRSGIVIVAALLAAAAAASASSPVRVPNTCNHAAYKPHRIVVACGDGNVIATAIHWSHWGARKAKGSATLKVNTCTPNCASGHFKRYPGAITLDRPHACPAGTEFLRLRYRYTHSRPHGVLRTGKATFACAT